MSRLFRRTYRRDGNEKAIQAALEAAGCAVQPISDQGAPDLLVCRGGRFLALCEVKQPKGALTPAQVRWRAKWTGPAPVTLRSVDDVLALLRGSR